MKLFFAAMTALALIGCSGGDEISINGNEFDQAFLTVDEAQNNADAGDPTYAYFTSGQRLAIDAPNINDLVSSQLVQEAADESAPQDFTIYEATDPEDAAAFDWWDFSVTNTFFVFNINPDVVYLVTLDDYDGDIVPLGLKGSFDGNSIHAQILIGGGDDGVVTLTIYAVVQGTVRETSDPITVEFRS